mmetsp:Transcript_4898/g.6133  ORF Transcript_4898/g.6133 Transcript_4898/m.6133 type:complete len:101 (-) Transcript_4898:43-345(-)
MCSITSDPNHHCDGDDASHRPYYKSMDLRVPCTDDKGEEVTHSLRIGNVVALGSAMTYNVLLAGGATVAMTGDEDSEEEEEPETRYSMPLSSLSKRHRTK